ncbi:hypothetical protein M8818_003583 [Zalaria obscura]|uniref:Uncharacterized protein n=1 Tax=Zalaria obscura TaxID=2024903 RepID=A0ACC3SDQ2_9PEZI
MRRRTQKHLVHFAIFFGILFLIIFLGRSQSNSKPFAWTTVRYRTTSASLPEPRGVCPGLTGSFKPALIVSRVAADGDPKWLDALADLYHLCVYIVDAPADASSTYLQVPANRGHEAMAYLTFLIDNYDNIPESGAVFVHGSRWAWHNDHKDYDNAALLTALNMSTALAPFGYHNLRCDWSVSTCSTKEAQPQGSMETYFQAVTEPWNARAVSDTALPRALAILFGGDEYSMAKSDERLLMSRTDAVRSQCCAQFVVSRDRVLQHTREEYVALRQWLLDGRDDIVAAEHLQKSKAAPSDDRVSGRILSYVWHILFMPRSVSDVQSGTADGVNLERLNYMACPSADECYCRLYGRCNLEGCTTPGRCHGQYEVPPDFKLPKDWAATHSYQNTFQP